MHTETIVDAAITLIVAGCHSNYTIIIPTQAKSLTQSATVQPNVSLVEASLITSTDGRTDCWCPSA